MREFIIPSSWVWREYGGYLSANPSIIENNEGRDFVFVRGGNGALYFLSDGVWYGLGGYITSDPHAAKDSFGRIHILVRGGDYALYDNIFDTLAWTYSWIRLGGYITSTPSAVMEPIYRRFLKIAVRGRTGNLYLIDLDINNLSYSWYNLGGNITSDPQIIFDRQNREHIFIRGGTGTLYENLGILTSGGYYIYSWGNLGGHITSDAKPVLDPNVVDQINTYVRGRNGQLYVNSLFMLSSNPNNWQANWYNLGGYISPAGSGSSFYDGSPEPVIDDRDKIHVFFRGNSGTLWDAVGTYNSNDNTRYFDWYNIGGYITSNPSAMWDSSGIGAIDAAARGGDGSLWIATLT